MRLTDWDVILMHYRNWYHYPHDATILELEAPALATCVVVPRAIEPIKWDDLESPPLIAEIETETIELSHHAWRFADHIYRLWVGYGPRSNTLVWRPDAA